MIKTKMVEGGRIVVPAAFRHALGIGVGDTIVMEVKGEELRIRSSRAAVERIRARLRTLPPGDMLPSEELIAERRAEAMRE